MNIEHVTIRKQLGSRKRLFVNISARNKRKIRISATTSAVFSYDNGSVLIMHRQSMIDPKKVKYRSG